MSRSSKRDRKRPGIPASKLISSPGVTPASTPRVGLDPTVEADTCEATAREADSHEVTHDHWRPAETGCDGARTDDHSSDYETLVHANTSALELLVAEFQDLRGLIRDSLSGLGTAGGHVGELELGDQPEQIDELLWQIRQRDERLNELERDRDSLQQQNVELAGKLAQQSVQNTVKKSNSSNELLSWEERKRLIIEQMETDSFDSEAFVAEIQANQVASVETDEIDPVAFVTQLATDLQRRNEELQRKNEEIGELRCLLEQQGGTREGGLAVGAAAIAQLMDADELVAEERERLKQMQAEWEEKFRQGEIEASIERATLSRERQELAKKQAQLDEQLEHMKRELRQSQELPSTGSGPSRRWFQKLGLSEGN